LHRVADRSLIAWRATGEAALSLTLHPKGARAVLSVDPDAYVGARGVVELDATTNSARAHAAAEVEIATSHPRDDHAAEGIPEPILVSAADASWRSRMRDGRWEVNESHRDYVRARDDRRARLRYLLTLLAKEIVVRTSGRHDAEDVLESLVEVLAHAEQNLQSR
jgi:hypothetical protein